MLSVLVFPERMLVMTETIENRLPLVPYPKKAVLLEGRFDLTDAVIVYEAFDSDAALMAETIAERCAEVSGRRPVITMSGLTNGDAVTYRWDETLGEEAYRLDITSEGVVITASHKRGRWYGAMTLCQLIGLDGTVPCAAICDEPDFRIRAISDDISRGQVSTVDHFKRIIRFCSEYKINTYFLYIEDLFQFQTNRRIGAGRGALTAEEGRELSAYAAKYHVDLAPLFESLGHQHEMVNMPEYADFRERPGSFSFAPGDSRTLRLMESFYEELAGVFRSPILFAGLDETTDIGTGRSKEILAERGHAKVYADYYNGLNRIAKRHGKQLWIYATLAIDYPESLDWIDKDIVMVNYTFSKPNCGHAWWDNLYTYMPILIEKGFTQMVSPSLMNWKRVFPDYEWAYQLTSALNQEGYRCGCAGSMNASWCDDGGENFREYNGYGYGFHAELSWNAAQPANERDFAGRFGASYFGPGCERLGEAIYHLGRVERKYGNGTFKAMYGPDRFTQGLQWAAEPARKAQEELELFIKLWFRGGRGPAVSRNAENVQYIEFACRRAQFAADLPGKAVQLVEQRRQWNDPDTPRSERTVIAQSCAHLADELETTMTLLRNEFEALWRRSCRIQGLDYNLTRMNSFIREVREIKQEMEVSPENG